MREISKVLAQQWERMKLTSGESSNISHSMCMRPGQRGESLVEGSRISRYSSEIDGLGLTKHLRRHIHAVSEFSDEK